ncbi:hypothetical protein [Streptomyces sp. NPDC059076]|uniref:hypothetical protein n=1 Tax=unclassified Streptomyces TaxID=2593676 RepID=UPI00367AFFD0
MGHPGRTAHGRGKRLITDERLRTELELCDRWGIPHSQFLGVGTGRWSPRDRDKAIAYLAYQRTVCPRCGTRHDDWDHGLPDQEDAYVPVVQRCIGCQVIDETQEQTNRDGDTHGKRVTLLPVSVHAALEAERELKEQKYAARRRARNQDED